MECERCRGIRKFICMVEAMTKVERAASRFGGDSKSRASRPPTQSMRGASVMARATRNWGPGGTISSATKLASPSVERSLRLAVGVASEPPQAPASHPKRISPGQNWSVFYRWAIFRCVFSSFH